MVEYDDDQVPDDARHATDSVLLVAFVPFRDKKGGMHEDRCDLRSLRPVLPSGRWPRLEGDAVRQIAMHGRWTCSLTIYR